MLHLTSGIGGTAAGVHDHENLVLHLVRSEAPTAAVQILVPALLLAAVTIGTHLLCLLVSTVRRPLAAALPPPTPTSPSVLLPPQPRHLGSMSYWRGWAIRSRRGPPPLGVHALH